MLSWSVTLQGAVNAIRAAGASSQPIALAGDLSLGEAWVNGKNSPLLVSTLFSPGVPADKSESC